jgi:hypothetical protein
MCIPKSTKLKEPVGFSRIAVLQDMMDIDPCVTKQYSVVIPKDQATYLHGLLYILRQGHYKPLKCQAPNPVT